MIISTYIIDDEFHAIEFLADYVQRTPGLFLSGTATDPLAALQEISDGDPPLLTFVDVSMPGLSGLELARLLRGKTLVVFTTSYREFGPEAYQLSVTDYMLKPFSYERFLDCIQKVKELLINREQAHQPDMSAFYIKSETKGKILKLVAKDIFYIKSDRNYIDIHVNDQVVTAYLTISEIAERLPRDTFFRVHRSYIINLDQVKAIEPGQVRLLNGATVELSKTYRDILLKKLERSLITSHRERGA